MPEVWTGDIVKKMHLNEISAKELAEAAGVKAPYVSMILHGARSPEGAQEKFEAALDAIIQKRKDAKA